MAGPPDRLLVRAGLAAAVLVTVAWAYVLLDRSPAWLPWLRVVIVACGVAAAAVIVAEHWLGGSGRACSGSVLPLALAAGLAGPLAYSLDTAATAHTGALPSAGPAVAGAFGGPGGAPGGAAGFGGTGTGPGAGAAPGQGTGTGPAGAPGSASGRPPGGTSGTAARRRRRYRHRHGHRHGPGRAAAQRRPGGARRQRRSRWPGRQYAGLRHHHQAADQWRGRLPVDGGDRRRGERGAASSWPAASR